MEKKQEIEKVLKVIAERAYFFRGVKHSYEAQRLEECLKTLKELIPPENFESLSPSTDSSEVSYSEAFDRFKKMNWVHEYAEMGIMNRNDFERAVDSMRSKLKSQCYLKERSNKIELLEAFGLFLEKNGYTDTDWRSEEPFAIDEFLKTESPIK